jgi:drug/metabolite transporter (DMT)-like permease
MSNPLSPRAAHGLLHATVFLWGVTAIIGKTISIHALPLVFYRVLLVTALLVVVLWRRGAGFAVPWRRAAQLCAAGTLVALHWVLFYGAIKFAGVTVAVLCLSTITFFTALLEPLVFRRAPRLRELVIGAMVVVGVVVLLDREAHASAAGYATGLASAFFSAAFGTWNGRLIQGERPERVTLYELSAAGVVCALAFGVVGEFVPPWAVSARDWGLLVVLAVACTAFPWLWTLRILRTLSPYTIALAVALEPVYSLFFAYLLWPDEERLTWRFYAGAAALFVLVLVNGLLKERSAARSMDTAKPRGA